MRAKNTISETWEMSCPFNDKNEKALLKSYADVNAMDNYEFRFARRLSLRDYDITMCNLRRNLTNDTLEGRFLVSPMVCVCVGFASRKYTTRTTHTGLPAFPPPPLSISS
jgi:hypothetical protein